MKEKKSKKLVMIADAAIGLVCIIVLALFIGKNASARKVAELLDLGNKYLTEQDYEEAIVAFQEIIEIDPKCEEAYRGLANVYIAMGDYESAIDILQQGIEQTGAEELAAYLEEIKEEAARQVSIQITDIKAESVINMDGYGCLKIQGEGSLSENWENPDSVVLPQTALVNSSGSFIFPYQSTFLNYHVSDGIISLTENSPYGISDDYSIEEYPPAYYNLDGSSAFALESGERQIDEHTTESSVWWCGPMQDGYALAIRHVHTSYFSGFAGGVDDEFYSYIIDKKGEVVCTLPEEFNETIALGNLGIDTSSSLGWCGEGLFAVFSNSYDEEWNYTSEAKGYMDTAGNMALDLSESGFTNLWPFHEGLAAVRDENGMVGMIDKTGGLVIPCVYSSLGNFSGDGLCPAEKDGQWGYIDRNNNVVIPFEYDDAYGADDGLAAVVKNGKCGLVDYSNQEAVPLEYDDISSFGEGAAYAVKDGILHIITK